MNSRQDLDGVAAAVAAVAAALLPSTVPDWSVVAGAGSEALELPDEEGCSGSGRL